MLGFDAMPETKARVTGTRLSIGEKGHAQEQ